MYLTLTEMAPLLSVSTRRNIDFTSCDKNDDDLRDDLDDDLDDDHYGDFVEVLERP